MMRARRAQQMTMDNRRAEERRGQGNRAERGEQRRAEKRRKRGHTHTHTNVTFHPEMRHSGLHSIKDMSKNSVYGYVDLGMLTDLEHGISQCLCPNTIIM